MTELKYIRIIGLFCLSIVFAANAYGQGASTIVKKRTEAQSSTRKAASDQAFKEVESAANHFISIFRQSLDFGKAFDEMFVSDAVERMRKADFFANMNFDKDLVRKTDTASLEKAYKALMGFYYLQTVFDWNNSKHGSEPDGKLPLEISVALRRSEYLSVLLTDVTVDGPHIKTRQDVVQLTEDFDRITGLYKKYLPADPFAATYYENMNEEDNIVRVRYGYPEFGIAPDVKVYLLEKDLFAFYLIREGTEMRVLTLGMGN